MATTKTATLTFRGAPELKEELRASAPQDHRFIANMVAVLTRDYLKINAFTLDERNSSGWPSGAVSNKWDW